ncbi:DinB family protein [Shouchella patagoniensis]|uniref:DinB family protein n=1 Tax=Shouchella patagoniensis TaxID=228576 RepID=UPI0009952C2D|nr:DinB family protein [Shouchella patagoniensis]
MAKQLISSFLDRRFQKESGFIPLMEAIKGLTAEQAYWKPSEKGNSIWQIVNHIAFWDSHILNQLKEKSNSQVNVDNDTTFEIPNDITDEEWQKTVAQINNIFQEIQVAVSQLDDSCLDEPAFEEDPLKVLLGDLAMHDSYHIGQIVYIRKLQGIPRSE